MTIEKQNGVLSRRSSHPVAETVERMKSLLETRGVKIFAVVDHSGEAEKAGMHMPATKLLIFGNPAAGTPVMLAAPEAAIDLPLKILVWEDSEGSVWLSWNSPQYLQERHGFPDEFVQNLAAAASLAELAGE